MTGVDRRAVERLVDSVESSLSRVVTRAVESIWEQVPAYADCPAPELRDDVTVHVEAIFRALLTSVRLDRPARREDFPPTERQAGRRVRQGVSLADFLRAFRVAQLTLWEQLLELGGDDPSSRAAALSLVGQVMRVIEVGSSLAAEAYLAAQQHELAEDDRLRRDLLEDLLAARHVFTGPKQALLRSAGLGPDTPLIVLSATRVGAPEAASARPTPRDAIAALGVITAQGFAVARQEEVVGVAPAPSGGTAALARTLERLLPELRRQGLAVGISTRHSGLPEVPEAYAEACTARDGLGDEPGVIALPLLSSLDYLFLRHGDTARRLTRPDISRFVSEDLANGGVLVTTFLQYVASDLNARSTAEHLHIHPNTAYYRLERIAERTGCDLRSFADVLQILVAVRLLDERRGRSDRL
ncbi:CdaR family transcriptional regulator [Streptomyces parvulus]|uniref:PucR family transcriptional regulator n=1 Tax=Streptomyces parvulus TaxID=146923 RepID=A0A369UTA2_9ACTN|nr:helix-turn-helix domain-containing protein [Streptomyces parvulus]RDD83982.1 PucR family transcriptional regulator [Streptomyces parvulus]